MNYSGYFRRRYRYALRLMVAGWFGALLMIGLSYRYSYNYAKVNPNVELARVLTSDAQYQRSNPDQRRGMLRRAYEIFYPKEWKSASPAEQNSLIEDTLKLNRPVEQLPPGYTEIPSILPVPSMSIQHLGALIGWMIGSLFSIPWLWYFLLMRLSELAAVLKSTSPF